MLFTILRGFAHFWNGKGPIFGHKIGLENSLPIVISFKQLKHMFDKEKNDRNSYTNSSTYL